MSETRSVHQAIVEAACAATGADQGWLLAAESDGLIVLAATGPDSGSLTATSVGVEGARGFVVSSGQPAAIRPAPTDTSNSGAGGYDGVPGSILATPCNAEDVVGVLEVVRAPGGEGFSFDDVEIASLLADISGAAISDETSSPVEVAPPARLSVELTELASQDARRYADVARVVEALLGQG